MSNAEAGTELPIGFIQLDRTFREISNDPSDLSEDFSFRSFFGKQYSWNDLTSKYRVVILSEAGTGKTEEIRNQTRVLRKQGKPAFFLRLENAVSDFQEAFEHDLGDHDEFRRWMKSTEEGWLFLDS
ncbi:MAG: hypothetical protein KDL87_18920, partial [Verrucomicrobiae bacterium]|nr:hypothetical protein [Verrucomicrobiae bacterium]